MDRWVELGDLLRSRRARGEPSFLIADDHRRVPGLRREEVAQQAGVSLAYYTRLEQGRAPNVSDDVLAAVCRALELDADETVHVWRLAHPAPRRFHGSTELVRAHIQQLLERLSPIPALILGRDRHLLAWNATAHALHAPHLDRNIVENPEQRPWWPELLFCDARVADLFVDWQDKARDTVADLRIESSRRPADDHLNTLVGDLRSRSREFDRLWGTYSVQPCAYHDRRYRHPVVGELALHDEFLELGDDQGQRIALFNPEPSSPSTEALERLATLLDVTA